MKQKRDTGRYKRYRDIRDTTQAASWVAEIPRDRFPQRKGG